jgi:hypothetical protein
LKALYYGGNSQVLRGCILAESVGWIDLDPPFTSYAAYDVWSWGKSGRDRMRGRTAAYSHEQKFMYPRDGIANPSLSE